MSAGAQIPVLRPLSALPSGLHLRRQSSFSPAVSFAPFPALAASSQAHLAHPSPWVGSRSPLLSEVPITWEQSPPEVGAGPLRADAPPARRWLPSPGPAESAAPAQGWGPCLSRHPRPEPRSRPSALRSPHASQVATAPGSLGLPESSGSGSLCGDPPPTSCFGRQCGQPPASPFGTSPPASSLAALSFLRFAPPDWTSRVRLNRASRLVLFVRLSPPSAILFPWAPASPQCSGLLLPAPPPAS